PSVPGTARPGVFLAIDGDRHEPGARAQPEVGVFQLVFEKGNPVLVNSGLLPAPFPFDGVVMQKQRTMILLDGFEAGRSRVLEVVLNEFEMNCRHDALGVRLWRGGFHNKLDSFGVIKTGRSDCTESENNKWRILSGGGP